MCNSGLGPTIRPCHSRSARGRCCRRRFRGQGGATGAEGHCENRGLGYLAGQRRHERPRTSRRTGWRLASAGHEHDGGGDGRGDARGRPHERRGPAPMPVLMAVHGGRGERGIQDHRRSHPQTDQAERVWARPPLNTTTAVAGPGGLGPERVLQRVGELAAGSVPLLRDLGQRPGQYPIRGRGQARPSQGERRRRLGHVREQHRHALVALERRHPGEQLVRHARRRILIGAPVHRRPLRSRPTLWPAGPLGGAGGPGCRTPSRRVLRVIAT